MRGLTRAFMWAASFRRKLIPPRLAALELATALWPALAMRALVQSGVADALYAAPASAPELAERESLHADAVERVLRMLAGFDVVRRRRDGRYELTGIGRYLARATDGSAAPFVEYLGESWQLEPWAQLAETMRTGEPVFERLYGAPLFTYLAERPETSRFFDAAISSIGNLNCAAVASAYDFSRFGLLVDVGGGTGAQLAAILRRTPALQGMLFEQQHVNGSALESAEFAGRVRFESGDFFTSVPAGADAYVLSHVLHDWGDDDAVRILRTVRTAMGNAARLLLVECVIPEHGRWDQGKIADVQMLAVVGGKERTRAEFERILSRADLRLVRVVPTAAAESVVECAPS